MLKNYLYALILNQDSNDHKQIFYTSQIIILKLKIKRAPLKKIMGNKIYIWVPKNINGHKIFCIKKWGIEK